MGLVPIVAFCAAFAVGDLAPSDPSGCVFLSDDVPAQNMTACIIRSTQVKNNREAQYSAYQALRIQHGDPGQVQWYTWCVDEFELKEFYQGLGIDTNLPEPV